MRMRGADVSYRLDIDFLDAINGAVKQLQLPDGSEIKVTIPAGTRDGQVLRLKGKGQAGYNQGAAGDALIEVHVRPHESFQRKGDDIHSELAISLADAVLGGKVEAATSTGRVTVSVPKGANTGTVLRLRGKGVGRADGSRGDQFITLKIMLPEESDAELEKFVATWSGRHKKPKQPTGS